MSTYHRVESVACRSAERAFEAVPLGQDRQELAEDHARDALVARLSEVHDIEVEVVVPLPI